MKEGRLAVRTWMTGCLRSAADWLFPRLCASCGRPVEGEGTSLCWDCQSAIPWIHPPFCGLCGDPVEGMVEHGFRCRWCEQHRVYFDAARSAARYRGPIKAALLALKYGHFTSLTRDLAPMLVACARVQFPDVVPDAVTFVPLHPTRERARTYNQAALLAQSLAPTWPGVHATKTLRRIRPTDTQTALSAEERRTNVRGAFAPHDPDWIRGRVLFLVDDVMTTGATVNECARVLKHTGAARVLVLTVARG